MEVPRDAIAEHEVARGAAGRLHPQAPVGAARAPLHVAEIVLQHPHRNLELPAQLVEAPGLLAQARRELLASGASRPGLERSAFGAGQAALLFRLR